MRELGIHHSVVSSLFKDFEAKDMKGLEEKRGKSKAPDLGTIRTK